MSIDLGEAYDRIAELEAENAALNAEEGRYEKVADDLVKQLLAAQHRIKVLRDALDLAWNWLIANPPEGTEDKIQQALATPDDTSEIDALVKDAERLSAIEKLFERKWSGTIGEPSHWSLVGSYRHWVQTMRGETFRDAIDAAMKETS